MCRAPYQLWGPQSDAKPNWPNCSRLIIITITCGLTLYKRVNRTCDRIEFLQFLEEFRRAKIIFHVSVQSPQPCLTTGWNYNKMESSLSRKKTFTTAKLPTGTNFTNSKNLQHSSVPLLPAEPFQTTPFLLCNFSTSCATSKPCTSTTIWIAQQLELLKWTKTDEHLEIKQKNYNIETGTS